MDRAVETLLGTSGRLSELHQLGFFFFFFMQIKGDDNQKRTNKKRD